MEKVLRAERDDMTSDVSIFLLVIMSYGANGQILCKDGAMISLQVCVTLVHVFL